MTPRKADSREDAVFRWCAVAIIAVAAVAGLIVGACAIGFDCLRRTQP